MSAIKTFFDNTFFVNGTEGIILFVICIAAAVCTIIAIAMAIAVAVALKRRKRGDAGEALDSVQKVQTPAGQAEQAEAEHKPTEALAIAPVKTPAKTPVSIFTGSGVRYNRSFTAKLIQSRDEVKSWYAMLKNELLSYKKVKSRMSWKRESYRLGRSVVARFAFRGSTLCIYLPLFPADYQGTKYRVEDISVYAAYADTPCMYRLKGARRARYATELIADSMHAREIERIAHTAEEYNFPYEDTDTLIERGLIKIVNGTPRQAALQDAAEEVSEPIEEIAIAEVPEAVDEAKMAAEESVVEETSGEASEEESTEEPAVEETAGKEPIEGAEVPEEETPEESVEEVPEASAEEPAEVATIDETKEEQIEEGTEEEAEVEKLSKREIADVRAYEDVAIDEDGIDVVGVMFRRRGRKVYWFDPDGKTWAKGEIALYKSPDNPPQEVIVVDNARISPSKLHLPLKPLHKVSHRPQTDKK